MPGGNEAQRLNLEIPGLFDGNLHEALTSILTDHALLSGSRSQGLLASAIGDSITQGDDNDASYFSQLCARSMGRLLPVGNYGIGGKSTALIKTEQLPRALSDRSKIVFVGCGTNDSTNEAFMISSVRPNIADMVAQIRSVGKIPVLISLLPIDGRGAVHSRHNAWLKGFCRKNGLLYLDQFSRVTDASGNLNAPYDQGDGIHPNAAGVIEMVRDSVPLFNRILSPAPLLPETDLANLGGMVTNTVTMPGTANAAPTGWTFATTAGVASTISRVAEDGPGNWLRFVNGDSADVSTLESPSTGALATAGIDVGDRIAFVFRFRLTPGTGFGFTAQVRDPFVTRISMGGNGQWNSEMDEGLYYRETVVRSDATSYRMWFEFRGAGTFDIARPNIINLTKLGL